MSPADGIRLPGWIRSRLELSVTRPTKKLLTRGGVATICEDASCPNRSECFAKPTAAFLILGPNCTRNCAFCCVGSGTPAPPNPDEPERVARTAHEMGLRYVVVTSVTRDDLVDGGAGQFALTVRALKAFGREMKVEVLVPDFMGESSLLETVLEASPDVLNHNLETVPSLYGSVRGGADFARSLRLLEYAKKHSPGVMTKSGLMLGLGETLHEVEVLLHELRTVGCDFVTIGQYMRPGKENLPVREYVRPEVFESLRARALSMGFLYVASSPLTRSSMNAEEMYSSKPQ